MTTYDLIIKTLKSNNPRQAIEVLIESGALENSLPELARMKAVPAGPATHHSEGDLLSHSLIVLEKVSLKTSDPISRFAALFHDLGKLATPENLWPRHFNHDVAGAKLAPAVLEKIGTPAEVTAVVSLVNRLHMKGGKFNEMRDSSQLEFARESAWCLSTVAAVIQADCGTDLHLLGIDDCIRIAAYTPIELGISTEKIESMAPVALESYIVGKKVEMLRATRRI
jgi:tRNA nucleotidyltransferase (CCA-adding enzyme)